MSTELPHIIAGPIVRKTTTSGVTFWLVTSAKISNESYCELFFDEKEQANVTQLMSGSCCQSVQVGDCAYINLITLNVNLPVDQIIFYNMTFVDYSKQQTLVNLCPHLLYQHQRYPSFFIANKIKNMLHGSCRNPHHESRDSLLRADELIGLEVNNSIDRPSLLMMSGDQIYADDVAGPTLLAIHQVIKLLGLRDEEFTDALVNDGEQLYQHSDSLYRRVNLLPKLKANSSWFGRSSQTPIFSSRFCDNHLITSAEVIAMYLLIWSDTLWRFCDLSKEHVSPVFHQRFDSELSRVQTFVEGLSSVQRLLAHIPTYMIFDDHDVTDDWNLSALWEQTVYSDPLGKQVIGNTLIGYWLCQGWGNTPQQFDQPFVQEFTQLFEAPLFDKAQHTAVIDVLMAYDGWQYTVDTEPALIVLDTRTHRWRSERRLAKPSGLMDWEALCNMQQELIGKQSVILVSAAPIFGLKLIEAIQHIVTALGFPLAVDAENWMAHSGAGNTMMQIFTHMKTPQNFVILSGDVHYSFAYDIKLHFKKSSPNIWQITCSGIKNEFPTRLLAIFDWLNRWLYAPYSPLNWFTKRRAMKIRPRKPSGLEHRHSVSRSGIGFLALKDDGAPEKVSVLTADGNEIHFISRTDDE